MGGVLPITHNCITIYILIMGYYRQKQWCVGGSGHRHWGFQILLEHCNNKYLCVKA